MLMGGEKNEKCPAGTGQISEVLRCSIPLGRLAENVCSLCQLRESVVARKVVISRVGCAMMCYLGLCRSSPRLLSCVSAYELKLSLAAGEKGYGGE
ncbi:hypothetical protein KS4_06260 [Poriferisphaera corsica]|uniref:Uncharacterized protein n=1 Tax=Poriferisphaera corsica TaxID=2528020 RepID=A0A517YQT6_9BACT|nr:hypothetical protein KS4_06260 [Poriferisphaera corsica]